MICAAWATFIAATRSKANITCLPAAGFYAYNSRFWKTSSAKMSSRLPARQSLEEMPSACGISTVAGPVKPVCNPRRKTQRIHEIERLADDMPPSYSWLERRLELHADASVVHR